MGRRAYESESLPQGKTRVRITVGYRNGKQVKRQKVFPKGTLVRDIKAWVAKEKAAFDAGQVPEADAVTVNQLSELWIRQDKVDIEAQTRKRYRQMLRKPLGQVLGPRRVQRVRTPDLQSIIEDMAAKGLQPRTIRYHFEVYRQLFEYAVSKGVIATSPVAGCRLPKANARRRVAVLEASEVDAFLRAASGSRFYTLYLLLVTTGLRISEALALEWRDIDLKSGRLTVNKSLEDLYGPRKSSEPKSKFAHRTLSIPERLVQDLVARERTETRVFPSSAHPYKSVSTELKKLLKGVGAAPLTLHGLRHTACSLMLRNGVNIKVVSYAMGHHSVAFTLDTYAHLVPDEADAVARAFEKALVGARAADGGSG